MRICLHGKAAGNCKHNIPWTNGFYGCNNTERCLIELEYCGRTPKECKGFGPANVTKAKDGTRNT